MEDAPITHSASIILAMPLAMTDTATYLMMGLALGFIVYVTIVRPWLGKARGKEDPLARSPLRMSLTQQKSLDRDMQNLLVELHDMARQMSAQIETRVAKLEILLSEADEKIARLESAESSAAARDASPDAFDAPMESPRTGASTQERPTQRSTAPARRAISEPSIEAPPDRYGEVYRLADQGIESGAIAQRLARPSGEIELILALRPRPRSPLDGPDAEASEAPAIASA